MNDGLRFRLGAVSLALLTLAAMVFAVLNFQQRSRFIVPDDGVTWMDSASGVMAWHVAPGTPGDRAGIKQGDYVESLRGTKIHRATDVTKLLWRAGPWTEVRYGIRRDGESFQVPLVTAPQDNLLFDRELPADHRPALSFHRTFHFCAPVECHARRAFLHFLPGLVRPLQLPLHRQAELRSTGRFTGATWSRCCCSRRCCCTSRWCFRSGRGSRHGAKLAAIYGVPRRLLALHIFVATRTGFHAVDRGANLARHDSIWPVPGHLFPAGRGHFRDQLSPGVPAAFCGSS